VRLQQTNNVDDYNGCLDVCKANCHWFTHFDMGGECKAFLDSAPHCTRPVPRPVGVSGNTAQNSRRMSKIQVFLLLLPPTNATCVEFTIAVVLGLGQVHVQEEALTASPVQLGGDPGVCEEAAKALSSSNMMPTK
jgi:hypothetical protein